MTRLLGIDVGAQRIGLAVADTAAGRIRPLATLRRATPDRDGASVRRVIDEQAVDEVVIGLPLSLDGTTGPQALATQAWAGAALAGLTLPVLWRDERMTTERAIDRVGGPGRGASGGPPSAAARRSHSARLDREAAVLILQAELDARAGIVAAG